MCDCILFLFCLFIYSDLSCFFVFCFFANLFVCLGFFFHLCSRMVLLCMLDK